MKRRKIYITAATFISVAILAGVITVIYLFNMPHRNVQSAKTDFFLTSSQIVAEYLSDKDAANSKYLSADGDSKIIEVTGVVRKISDDYSGLKVVLLKGSDDRAGVSSTFTSETNINASDLKIGQTVTIKGVIRSGAGYDEDLEIFENVILTKCDIIK